jgi:G3E family GTPase
VLNKTDLVTAHALDHTEASIRSMNSAAQICRDRNAALEADDLLNLGGFDIRRALDRDPSFLDPGYPFGWVRVFDLAAGRYEFALTAGVHPSLQIVMLPIPVSSETALSQSLIPAALQFSEPSHYREPLSVLRPGAVLYELNLSGPGNRFCFEIVEPGVYALFSERSPGEIPQELVGAHGSVQPALERPYKRNHVHGREVRSVAIRTSGNVDRNRLNVWLQELLTRRGTDIFRMKGILSVQGEPRRVLLQGVHQFFEGVQGREWGDEPRQNSLITIGRHLDRQELQSGFLACLT